jgi:thioredoxin-like negative regulator of GroEL
MMVNIMITLNSIEEINEFISSNKLAFLYISSNNCDVCTVLFPKIEEVLCKYPKITYKKVDVDKLPEVAGHLSIFTIPVLILYIEEKEAIRKARFISIDELDKEIERYYNLID